MHSALKFAEGSETEIEGLLAPYGGLFNGRDVQGEFFSGKTDFVLDLFTDRPLMFHHGLDPDVEVKAVGRVEALKTTDKGLWMRAWLDKRSEYYESIKKMIGEQALELSSGAISHLVQRAKSGEILRWPVIEGSLTPTAACAGLATVDFAEAKSHFKSAGIDLDVDALKATMDAAERNALPDSDFAYVDSDGNRHLPINDESHTRAALARFSQTTFVSDTDKATARKKILAAAKKFGIAVSEDDNASGKSGSWEDLERLAAESWPAIKLYADGTYSERAAADPAREPEATKSVPYGSFPEGSYEDLIQDLSDLLNPAGPYGPACWSCIIATFPDYVIVERHDMDADSDEACTFWRVGYAVGEDMEPALGDATQMEQTYVPVKAHLYEGPLTLDAQALARHARALGDRTKGITERRIADGRVLSAGNQARISDAAAQIKSTHETLTALLDASVRLARDQAQARALAEPDAVQRRLAALSLFVDSTPST